MINKNFLITSVSAKVQLVESLKSACDFYNVKLISSDLHENNAALYFSHDYVVLPKIDDVSYLSVLLRVCKEYNIGFIIPTRDADLDYFSIYKKELNSHNIVVCQSCNETIRICNDKFIFRDFCLEKGFLVPYQYTDLNKLVYPCVLKTKNSSASDGVFILNDKIQLEYLLGRFGVNSIIVEEFIPFREFSIDAFFDLNGTLVEAVPRERLSVSLGESKISKTIDNKQLKELVTDVGNQLKFMGHIIIQAFYSDEKIYLIEVNPRFGGASNLSFKAGLDSPKMLIGMMLNDYTLLNEKRDIVYGLTMLRYSRDFFVNE